MPRASQGADRKASLETRAGDGHDPRERKVSRRSLLKTGATASLVAVAGCLGTGGTSGSGTPTSDTGSTAASDGPDTPWTTQDLAEEVEDGTTVSIYSASGDPPTWEVLIDVINDEFGTELESNVVVGNAAEISQRLTQERQADSDKADVITAAINLNQRIYDEGREYAGEWYELGVEENFWFGDVLNDAYMERWYVSAYDGGPSTSMAINPELFEERGLDIPRTYNDLFEDQYEGLEVLLPSYIVSNQIGWIIGHHAAQTDMSNREWMDAMLDHLSFSGVSSHSAGGRAVGEGNAPMMFYNFPWTLSKFIPEFPVYANFVDDAAWIKSTNGLSINSEAPNPWAARFVLSAALEESVQRRMLDDVPAVIPGRLDLDYSSQNPSEYAQRRLSADVTRVTFWEEETYSRVGQQARNEWIDI